MTLYNSRDSKDNCGFGLIAHSSGKASHKIVRTAISALSRMSHRGGIAADGRTGDGCGVLMQKPDSFFRAIAEEKGWSLGARYGVGLFFLPREKSAENEALTIINEELEKETLSVAGWRDVPINPDVLGEVASESLPHISQVFVSAPSGWGSKDLERRLYMVRRRIEKRLEHQHDCYAVCLSNVVTIYKGLCRPVDLNIFFPDLADLRMQSSICLFHQRFSTNTLPRWELAQPFRYLAHNGEINTITGNRQWAEARSYKFRSPVLPDMQDAAPFVGMEGSDSSSLDNMLELMLAGGMDIFRAFRLLIPPAWHNHPSMDEDLRAFYDFNSMHMEPWDGPAGIVMSDGRYAACGLDRNGLRPARYVITRDKLITLASEVGIWDYEPDEVVEKGRVGPGELLVVDTLSGRLWTSWDIDRDLKNRHPYRQWMDQNCKRLLPYGEVHHLKGRREMSDGNLLMFQKIFGYSREEIEQVIRVLAEKGQEAVGSMGDDTPIAVLSQKPRLFYDYFRQKFAQVTNPPIDPLRENHVMSLATCIGKEQNVFNETHSHASRVLFDSPVLLHSDFQQLLILDAIRSVTLETLYTPADGIKKGLEQLCIDAVNQVKSGVVLIVLSDRGISKERLPIPMAMAVGAVHRALIVNNLRCDSNIIVETGSARDPHHFAVLIGYGATAVYPYLVYEILAKLYSDGVLEDEYDATANYRKGINKGLFKIMSKMGISTIASYRCSQLFEILGVSKEITELCFTNGISRIGGVDFSDIERDGEKMAALANKPFKYLPQGGLLKYVHGGEYHAYNPDVVLTLQKAVNTGSYDDYLRYAQLVNSDRVCALRDLLELQINQETIPVDEVEPAENLYKRFDSAAMSIGALGPEAHESLAIGMNRLGGNSNSGEGGEDPSRFNSERVSKIKQVASGRFGVTPHYLMNADVIQIKMAQGAKPGEGGQLPGHKVTVQIAKLRYSLPGITLISPPPHHDIYSIEDLAQLIFDLKQLNPGALVSVKLVSEPGVGTIATGVAKAYADLITISGYDGGTGASPLTSVKYAGSPWELGLVEAHHALVENGLRNKVRLQVDGGLKTGLDIVKAAILGAESFGFGTAPLIALGCKYLRICHLNNCATGVATQDEKLRQNHFHGKPEKVMNYFHCITRETREILSSLGVKKLVDLIGRTDLLKIREAEGEKQKKLELDSLLEQPDNPKNLPLYCSEENDPTDKGELNLLIAESHGKAAENGVDDRGSYTIRNTDRSVGARLSGLLAKKHGRDGMLHNVIEIALSGTAGQSLGAWNSTGLNIYLIGDANDYVGKGMAGGKIVIRPAPGVSYKSHEAAIIGNTCLYGATGGRLYAAGRAGERFAVRNSGAKAVVEGIGDNGCEYMTGGIVTVLGDTGINFGAGMTGGFAYVLDLNNQLETRTNLELVEVISLSKLAIYQEHLRGIISKHANETESDIAELILDDFISYSKHFKLVKPRATDVRDLLGHRGGNISELQTEAA